MSGPLDRSLMVLLVLIAVMPPLPAEAHCDPCDQKNQLRWQKGVVVGARALPRARQEALRKVILDDFRRRARRLGGQLMSTAGIWQGRTYHSPRVNRFGQLTVAGERVELAIGQILIASKSDHPDFRHLISEDNDGRGRDELWVFWGNTNKERAQAILRIGAPGESGTVGSAFVFVCGQRSLCALTWKTGEGGPYTGQVKLMRIPAKGTVATIAELAANISDKIRNGGNVSPARCGAKTMLCLTGGGEDKHHHYRFELSASGFSQIAK